MNIGRKPTFFRNRKAISLEVYILDFSLNIYGKYLRVFLIDRIREEIKFSDVNSLKRQIFQDIEKAKVILTQEVENYTENLKLFEGIR
jgi:riboflavin kinase/FMN adenylyltransferase